MTEQYLLAIELTILLGSVAAIVEAKKRLNNEY